jgi:hypothetical protein
MRLVRHVTAMLHYIIYDDLSFSPGRLNIYEAKKFKNSPRRVSFHTHLEDSLSWDAPATHTLNGTVHSRAEHNTNDSPGILINDRTSARPGCRQWLKQHVRKGIIRSRLFVALSTNKTRRTCLWTYRCLTASKIAITQDRAMHPLRPCTTDPRLPSVFLWSRF